MVKILQFNNSNKKYNFDNVPKESCILICKTIKTGKDKVKNPLTNNTINYNSPIVKQLLQLCYTKYNMKKRVKDIVDIDVLFDTKLKTIKGAGLSAIVSNVVSKCKEYISGVSYDEIYNKVKILDTTQNDIKEPKFIFIDGGIKTYYKNNTDVASYINDLQSSYVEPTIDKPQEKHFILLVGKPGAGKSYFIKNKLQDNIGLSEDNFINLNPDDLRYYNTDFVNEISGKLFNSKNKGKDYTINGKITLTLYPDTDGNISANMKATVNTLQFIRDSMQQIVLPNFLESNKNIIYDSACNDTTFCGNLLQNAKKKNYKLIIVCVDAQNDIALARVKARQEKDGRYADQFLESIITKFNIEEKQTYIINNSGIHPKNIKIINIINNLSTIQKYELTHTFIEILQQQIQYDLKSKIKNHIELFISFVKSCNNIKSKTSITFDELIIHIDCIVNLFSLLDSKTIENVVFYNDSFILAYNKFISEYEDIKKKYENDTQNTQLLKPHNGSINSVSEKFQETLLETINEKMESYKKKIKADSTITAQFNVDTIYYDIFTKIYLCKDFYKKTTDDLEYLIFSTNKYLPKYFSYACSGDYNFKYIIAFLNHFSKDIRSDIVIEQPLTIPLNNLDKKSISDKIAKLNDNVKNTRLALFNNYKLKDDTLLSLLFDNFVFTKYNNQHCVYINKFTGTYYTNILDKYILLYELPDIQIFNLEPGEIKTIEVNYKNFMKAPFSTNVNKALSLLSREYSFILDEAVKERLIEIFKPLVNISASPSNFNVNANNKILYVFHGTTSKLLLDSKNKLVLTSLLSTTLNINTAINFGRYIYVFRIYSNKIHYINLNDTLQQILLLPGTTINVLNTGITREFYNIFLCDIENHPMYKDYYKNLLKQITNNNPEQLSKFSYKLTRDDALTSLTSLKALKALTTLTTLTTFNIINDPNNNRESTLKIDGVVDNFIGFNLIEEATQENLLRFSFTNLKYTFHQMIINYIYNQMNKECVIKYNLVNCFTGELLIGFKYSAKLSFTNLYQYNFNLLITDLLCGANIIDIKYYYKAYIFTAEQYIRYMFKGTGIFDGNGIQTIYEKDVVNNITAVNNYIKDSIYEYCNSDQLYSNVNPGDFEEIKQIIIANFNKLDFDLEKIIADINSLIGEFQISSNSIEYIELTNLLNTIKIYFNLRKTYIQNNHQTIIELIRIKIQKTGGVSMRSNKRYTPYPREKPTKSLKERKSTNNIVKYIDGYEIAPNGYSSTTTMSVDAFKAIQKRFKSSKSSRSSKFRKIL